MEDAIIGMLSQMLDLATLSADALKFTSAEVNTAKPIWNYFAIVGAAMTLVYFLMEMNQKLALEGRDMNLKSFFAPFLKLMVAFAVLFNGITIIGYLLSLNNAMIVGVDAALTKETAESLVGSDLWKQMIESIEDGSFWIKLAFLIPAVVCFLVSLILQLVWWFKSITYKLEILFRCGIAPIACADVYSGQNSNAVRFLKGFLVLGLYGVSLVTLTTLSVSLTLAQSHDAIADADIWEILVNIIQLALVAPFAALSVSSLARQAAKEALGV